MEITNLETDNATLEQEYLLRVQIPPEDTARVLAAITEVTPLQYGRYACVAFRSQPGILQFKALEGSKEGGSQLYELPSQQVSFTIPADQQLLAAVIEAIYASHPYEEPVILVQPVLSTRFKYESGGDNPNKWWRREQG